MISVSGMRTLQKSNLNCVVGERIYLQSMTCQDEFNPNPNSLGARFRLFRNRSRPEAAQPLVI